MALICTTAPLPRPHPTWRLTLAALGAAALLAAAGPARAVDWLCNLSEEADRLICLADFDLREDATDSSERDAAIVPVIFRGTRFPLNPRLVFTVDLWSPPTEMDRVQLLAQSVICFRSPGCTVTLSPVTYITAGLSRAPVILRH
jgi:hypothetical protein